MKNSKNYSESNLYKIRHTCEHVFNQAVEELYPDQIMRAIGPAIETGWYNDARWSVQISEKEFKEIEKRMQKIINKNLPLVYKEIDESTARSMFAHNPFKQELIDEFVSAGSILSVYYTGDPEKGEDVFVDLCKGPHAKSTGEIKAFKLLSVAGAYWRGSEENEMLTRIYGTAFETKEELNEYLYFLEEAKKRDHRKIAKDMDLIVFSDLVGSGLPMYTPRGSIVRSEVYNFSRQLNQKIGYSEVHTPNFNRAELFKVSGHYDKYKDDMFKVISNYSEEELFYKPMNCPQHTQLFASKTRSYRDLPYRVADFSNLARDERPGELHGIMRSRIFTQDDGHAFVRPDQIGTEFKNILGVIDEALKVYGLDYYVRLSLRDATTPEKYLGDDEIWNKAELVLKNLANELDIDYVEAPGEAAIYGPKMDFIAKDSLKREWQISTIQIDMNMPHRFGLKYIAEDGTEQEPVMIHRAIVGSERFIGIIIEHFAGAFPAWLHPEQVAIIPVSENQNDYVNKVLEGLQNTIPGVRVKIYDSNDRMQKKIRNAQIDKIPYMLVLGEREQSEQSVHVRLRTEEQLGSMSLSQFAKRIQEKITSKALDL